jgi:hypothetical protein
MVIKKNLLGVGGWLAVYVWLTLLSSLSFLTLMAIDIFQGKATIETLFGSYLAQDFIFTSIRVLNIVVAILLLVRVPNIINQINAYLVFKVCYWMAMAIAVVFKGGPEILYLTPYYVLCAVWNYGWHEYFERSDRILTNYYK